MKLKVKQICRKFVTIYERSGNLPEKTYNNFVSKPLDSYTWSFVILLIRTFMHFPTFFKKSNSLT